MTKLEFLDRINDILIGLNTAESDALGSLYDELMRSQWIPVEEELPEERKVVWVRKHFNKEVLGEFDIYDSAAFCNGEFQCDNSCNVTHWMEILPPRKEDKE